MGKRRWQSQPVDEGSDTLAAERADCWKGWERGDIGEDGKEPVADLLELFDGVGIQIFNIEAGVELVEGLLDKLDAAALKNHGLQVLEGQIGQRRGTYLHERVQVGVVSFAGGEAEEESRRVRVRELGLRVCFLDEPRRPPK